MIGSRMVIEAARLAGGSDGPAYLHALLGTALGAVASGAADRGGPFPGGGPGRQPVALAEACGGELLPAQGIGARALGELARVFAAGAADPADPACAAHLHCPPLAVAVAADLVVSTLNPSLDSWDQAPSGTALEEEVIRTLAGLVGYDPGVASGSVTTGGTESNLTGLLLARERGVQTAFGVRAVGSGLPAADVGRLRVLCSAAAHFSVARSAGVLGLGEDAVLPVPVDAGHRMDPAGLRATLTAVRSRGEVPLVVVATAGTTDLGAIDPLPEVADAAAAHGAWLHVDAAYGGAALFSSRLAPLLAGLERADSVGLDMHKFGWQPVAAGLFLTRDAVSFQPLQRSVAYLNGEGEEGGASLLGRSVRTTRRADAFKIAVTLRALGRRGLGALVDQCHALARYTAGRVSAEPRLELFAEPVLSTVVFRYLPATGCPDRVNTALRRVLLAEGRAVLGRTEVNGGVRLKLTLLNPQAMERDIDRLLDAVVAAGEKEDR